MTVMEQIDRLKAGLDGEVQSKGRVIDGLLDVRLAAAGLDDVTTLVDAILGEVPGKAMVRTDWLAEQLEVIEAALHEGAPS